MLEKAKKAARERGIGLGQVVRQALERLARGGRRPRIAGISANAG